MNSTKKLKVGIIVDDINQPYLVYDLYQKSLESNYYSIEYLIIQKTNNPKNKNLLNKLIDFLKDISYKTGCQIYLEPGEAVVLDSGVLIGEIIDCFKPNNPLSPYMAITDISATCHIPDVLEAPYRPALLNEPNIGYDVIIGGPSCLAGDVIGQYKFETLPKVGERIAFLDQAHYTMVKTNFFNGVKLPSIAIWDSETNDIEIIKTFSYHDFENRLS